MMGHRGCRLGMTHPEFYRMRERCWRPLPRVLPSCCPLDRLRWWMCRWRWGALAALEVRAGSVAGDACEGRLVTDFYTALIDE